MLSAAYQYVTTELVRMMQGVLSILRGTSAARLVDAFVMPDGIYGSEML